MTHEYTVHTVLLYPAGIVRTSTVECGSSAVECSDLNPLWCIFGVGHFRSLHGAPVHSAV